MILLIINFYIFKEILISGIIISVSKSPRKVYSSFKSISLSLLLQDSYNKTQVFDNYNALLTKIYTNLYNNHKL